jgi:uncharacterized protein (DUF2384 family)
MNGFREGGRARRRLVPTWGEERGLTVSTASTARPDHEPQRSDSLLYRRIVHDARRSLRDAEIGSITGVSDRAVQNWASGASKPDGLKRDRLMELKYVIEQLSDVYTDEGVEIWLHAHQRRLDGHRPVDLLQEGRFEDVLNMIERLAGGPRPSA